MRLLLDNNLSVRLPAMLGVAGLAAVHVRDHDMQQACDEDVMRWSSSVSSR